MLVTGQGKWSRRCAGLAAAAVIPGTAHCPQPAHHRSFCTSCPILLAPAAPSNPQNLLQQSGEVITRLAPSQRIPGLRGVFVTRAVKKFHPIEVLPTAAMATSMLTSTPPRTATAGSSGSFHTQLTTQERADSLEGSSSGSDDGGTMSKALAPVTLAPPLVVNLAFAPRHSISLRRFLALRHMFSTADFLQTATEDGWFLVAPSRCAPLCADGTGLAKWVQRHHPRYLVGHRGTTSAASPKHARHHETGGQRGAEGGIGGAFDGVGSAAERELARLEAALDNGEELTEAQLRALADKEAAAVQAAEPKGETEAEEEQEEEDDDDDDDYGDDDDENGKQEDLHKTGVNTNCGVPSHFSSPSLPPQSSSGTDANSASPQLRTLPPLITEDHLFEINDGVPWELPPSDDLANLEYWKQHRERMFLYESTGDADAAQQRETLMRQLRTDPRVQAVPEKALHFAVDDLFEILKRKANVSLSVDSATGLLTLVPLQDLAAGEELLLHYGRGWWTGRLLSPLLLAAADSDMAHIRWIEQLFARAEDKNEFFPQLVPARQQRRSQGSRKSRRRRLASDQGIAASAASSEVQNTATGAESSPDSDARKENSPLVLYNTVTRKKATDAAALAYAIRRSCTHQAFFNRLVLGDAARGLPPVFHLSTPDAEVPMRVLRRVLLTSLRGVAEKGEQGREASAQESAEAGHGELETRQRQQQRQQPDASATESMKKSASVGDDDDGVFSV